MRQLDSNELLNKCNIYFSNIIYSEIDDLTVKITQLFNFLQEQEISKRVLERIEEDFKSLKESLSIENFHRNRKFYSDILKTLTTRELQGAFGYFIIVEKFNVNLQHRTHYLDMIRDWYHGKDFHEYKQKFNSNFFEPFTELFEWYLTESQTLQNIDYFSQEMQESIVQRIEELEKNLITQLNYGQEVVFNEVNDIKKLVKKLNKKNWNEIIKGKFIDLAVEKVISFDTAKKIIEFITGEGMKLLK